MSLMTSRDLGMQHLLSSSSSTLVFTNGKPTAMSKASRITISRGCLVLLRRGVASSAHLIPQFPV
ncbi:rCG59738 [Rattus norvegicus]|uniref:RCG59738 n=1 Tax=Rattus norvegicus TaxID=10116 RepID=A6HRY7_RAT|nr:rCG59738 [Rattus norvegicus]